MIERDTYARFIRCLFFVLRHREYLWISVVHKVGTSTAKNAVKNLRQVIEEFGLEICSVSLSAVTAANRRDRREEIPDNLKQLYVHLLVDLGNDDVDDRLRNLNRL